MYFHYHKPVSWTELSKALTALPNSAVNSFNNTSSWPINLLKLWQYYIKIIPADSTKLLVSWYALRPPFLWCSLRKEASTKRLNAPLSVRHYSPDPSEFPKLVSRLLLKFIRYDLLYCLFSLAKSCQCVWCLPSIRCKAAYFLLKHCLGSADGLASCSKAW